MLRSFFTIFVTLPHSQNESNHVSQLEISVTGSLDEMQQIYVEKCFTLFIKRFFSSKILIEAGVVVTMVNMKLRKECL